jgi:hypothetical protein
MEGRPFGTQAIQEHCQRGLALYGDRYWVTTVAPDHTHRPAGAIPTVLYGSKWSSLRHWLALDASSYAPLQLPRKAELRVRSDEMQHRHVFLQRLDIGNMFEAVWEHIHSLFSKGFSVPRFLVDRSRDQ